MGIEWEFIAMIVGAVLLIVTLLGGVMLMENAGNRRAHELRLECIKSGHELVGNSCLRAD